MNSPFGRVDCLVQLQLSASDNYSHSRYLILKKFRLGIAFADLPDPNVVKSGAVEHSSIENGSENSRIETENGCEKIGNREATSNCFSNPEGIEFE